MSGQAELIERQRIAEQCRAWAGERFDAHGPYDARGAALWDVAAWLCESAEVPA